MMRYKKYEQLVMEYGNDVMESSNMDIQKKAIQHGSVSIYEHSLGVACLSIYISLLLGINVNKKSLVRGALLHDYFLYDWHIKGASPGLHGFKHARYALNNASKEFFLNPIEKDIIEKHMFPLNIKPPKYRESIIVCIADKICTLLEVSSHLKLKLWYLRLKVGI